MKFSNPIIPGFFSDPSVCRVGEDYYLVTSSFEYFPGVPIFHSKDLVHWHQIGHCLTREKQLALKNELCSRGIWAPTIRFHDNKLYMTSTNRTAGGNFFVYTDDPAGEWSDPIWVDQKGIDPSFLFDEGKVYYTTHGNLQSEIDIKTGKVLTEPRVVWEGSGAEASEGPHLYKINGLYYLLTAEGGTGIGHMVTIARSDSPWGPFSSCPHNPILTHRHLYFNPVHAVGHADLVQAHDDSWWMVCHGIRQMKGFFPRTHILGRETFLAPVEWDENGWPVVGNVNLEMDARNLSPHIWEEYNAHDDFDEKSLRFCWNFLRNPYNEDWSLEKRPGSLMLHGSAVTLNDIDSPAFIAQRQRHFDCCTRTVLDFSPGHENEEAGMVALMNERHHYEIGVTLHKGARQVFVRRRIGDLSAVVARRSIDAGDVTLEIRCETEKYTFSYAVGSNPIEPIAEGDSRYLSTEVAQGFTGVYLGMYATGNGKRSTAPAFFDWFEYTPI